MHQHRPISEVATAGLVAVEGAARGNVCSQPMFCAIGKVVSLQVHSGREWGKLEICSVMVTLTYSFFQLKHDQRLPTII